MVARTLIFDLDGSIWDSYPWYAGILHKEVGHPHRDSLTHFHNGNNVIRLAGTLGISRSRLIKACCASIEGLCLYEDVQDVLETLVKRGTRLGIVTNLTGAIAKPILQELGFIGYFSSLIYAAKKPSPSGIRKALSELKHPAEAEAFYIGDTLGDGLAAERAGISFAWASFGYSRERPKNTKVDLKNFGDVLKL